MEQGVTREEFEAAFEMCGCGSRGTYKRMALELGRSEAWVSQLAKKYGFSARRRKLTPADVSLIAEMSKTMTRGEIMEATGYALDTIRRARLVRNIRFGMVPMTVATAEIGHAALRLYVLLACHADKTKRQTWVSVETLAELMGVSDRHIFRLLAELEAAKLIERTNDMTVLRAG